MDDLGAEHLSELSVSDKNIKPLEKTRNSDPIPSATASATLRAAFLEQKCDNSDATAKPVATPRNRHKDRAILGSHIYHNHHNEADEEETSLASSSDGREKTDATPENVKKIDDVIQQQQVKSTSTTAPTATAITTTTTTAMPAASPNKKNENHSSAAATAAADVTTAAVAASITGMTINDEQQSQTTPNSTIADDDESSASSATAKQQCLAFTIDFGDDSVKDSSSSVAAAAKYKSMVERFQNRHRRGASMSKLEGAEATPPSALEPPTPTAPPRSPRAPQEVAPAAAPDTTVKVKMRARDRSTSRVKDATKRHSWSPRSSTTEPPQHHPTNHNHPRPAIPHKTPNTVAPATTKKVKTKPSNLTLNSQPEPPRREKTASNKPFTPRSTAMQMALQKIDFLCPQPPLDDYHHNMALNDNVSEAGTYTLDGDNYTEEQKDLMNIDKTTTTSSEVSSSGNHMHQRPKDLPLRNSLHTGLQGRRRNNVLEVNFYHDTTTTPYKPPTNKTSYLEKIKSRVRNITVKPQQTQPQNHHQQEQHKLKEASPPDPDVGTFTSVTTSGVLAKKTTLDSHPKLTRRSSLSTSQIDSSEYVSTEAKLKSNSGAAYNGGYTDHQKSGYRLNVFTTQTDAQVLSAIESPESPVSKHSDTGGLKTAQTKNDWIQEWARNARARSVASVIKGSPVKQSNQQQYDIMSRSYNCGAPEEDPPTDDSMIYRNKNMDRFRMGDFDYASDPNVSAQRPPKSPTKIPSPMHSIGRARSASHTRASLQNIIQDDPNNTDLYLQKTAAAISNLQQTLSRKNSIKSPPSSRDSPKKVPNRHQYYSADEYSPQHSIEAKLLLTNPLNKRGTPGNNLMTNSYHEQLVLDVKIPRARKNSYDAQALTVSPARRQHQPPLLTNKQYYGIDQTRGVVVEPTSIKQQQQQQLSPLRRSSSFSTKCRATTTAHHQQQQQQHHQKRPNVNNLYTPPTVRHNYIGGQQQPVSAIKKSASSTTFRHVYSDYDDNVAYYINDEDDLVDVEYYGSSDDDIHSPHEDYEDYNDDLVVSEEVHTNDVPLTNTRYNKALLMRIERSKQKVAGTTVGHGVAKPNLLSSAGVAACPNTPELPRRTIKSAPRSSMRQSMPRDSSLNRLAGHIPNSLASAKKQILQTANAVVGHSATAAATNPSSSSIENANSKRIQPKYMDISKYKPAQGNNFLRKNDAKSTLKPEIRRSPSSASMGLSRTDATRASNRSVKSATSGRGTSASAAWRDTSVSKQKEVELAMWKRRAKYDPMRAAAEDRRKKEEAKKSTTTTMTMTTTTTTTQGNSNNGQAGGAVTERKKPQLIVRWSKMNSVKYSNSKRYNNYNNNCIRSDGGSIVYVRQLRGHSHFTMVSDH
ncbi:uncharacterized protein LOC129940399 isoform X2 [Eupeodes corollae]|uniref:uncharacterized protein LOC129940399 isoform X2 n=1 Tax=Eupeodes corollae TaxID=290404 RepID=UPI0024924A93|nr:uncharacterized protein LOC129940399 isoform X2 [Eupeodes corollae]